MEFTNHTQILNYLIERYKLDTYLEIGVQHKVNFNAIKLPAENKVSVDPDPDSGADYVMTSSEFFKNHMTTKRYDLIFIDGEHTKYQVQQDFEDSLYLAVKGSGIIVLHDTVPELEERTFVPRQTKQWNGDVYKFACRLGVYANINFTTFPCDHGVTVVWVEDRSGVKPHEWDITWEDFTKNKESLLRINKPLPTSLI